MILADRNTEQKLKMLVSSTAPGGHSYEKLTIFNKIACFLALFIYVQLPVCLALMFWIELLKLKRMMLYLSKYVHI